MMMWPFALKEVAYCLNWLSLCSDGQSCEATFFNIDKEFIDPSIYHTFGSPCFVLTLVFNRVLGMHPYGSHNLVLVSMLVTLHLTPYWLL